MYVFDEFHYCVAPMRGKCFLKKKLDKNERFLSRTNAIIKSIKPTKNSPVFIVFKYGLKIKDCKVSIFLKEVNFTFKLQ